MTHQNFLYLDLLRQIIESDDSEVLDFKSHIRVGFFRQNNNFFDNFFDSNSTFSTRVGTPWYSGTLYTSTGTGIPVVRLSIVLSTSRYKYSDKEHTQYPCRPTKNRNATCLSSCNIMSQYYFLHVAIIEEPMFFVHVA